MQVFLFIKIVHKILTAFSDYIRYILFLRRYIALR